MIDKRNKNKSFIASTLITLAIILMLTVPEPASAVIVSISGLSGQITQGTSKTFIVAVTLDNADKFVPISNVTLDIEGHTSKQWTFNPVCGGITEPAGDKNITIKVISAPNSRHAGYGYGYGVDTIGYGYGYDFGYGYGYGYNQGQGGKHTTFIYEVTLSTANLAVGDYTATAHLNTGNSAKPDFTSIPTSFTVVSKDVQPKGNISGMKFNDSNANGIKDTGEPGLENWTIKLVDSSGSVETAITDANGNYSFSGLLEGKYTVTEVPEQNWTQTFPQGGVYTVKLKPGANVTDADFGNYNGSLGIPQISGMKFNDSNGNRIKDAGEHGLADWLVKLKDSYGNTLTTITNSSGNYTFHLNDSEGGVGAGSNLRGLNYTVEEIPKPGWTQTFPEERTYNVHYTGPQNQQPLGFRDLEFGNTELPSTSIECKLPTVEPLTGNISGMKFNDSNADGIKDAGEQGLGNWTIKLVDTSGSVETAITDNNGSYNFSGLLEGIYTVAEVSAQNWTQTFPKGGVYTVKLKPGANVTDADFGNYNGSLGIPQISGMKFNDLNGNGTKDPGETGLADWLVKLKDSYGNTLTTITNSSGNYTFHLNDSEGGVGAGSNLRGLNYTVQEIPKPGWILTLPTGETYNIHYTGPQNLQPFDHKDTDFGNKEILLQK